MSIAFICPDRDVSQWCALIEDYEVQVWPQIKQPQRVELVIAWNPPKNVWAQFTNLRLISSLGAGVDHLIQDTQLPAVPIVRVVDADLARDMCSYVLMAIFNHQRDTRFYLQRQLEHRWDPKIKPLQKLCVGILGLGVLGGTVAQQLIALGFDVCGYSMHPKQMEGVTSYHGSAGLTMLMSKIDVLVNLLPLTPETNKILAKPLFELATKPFYLINVARGAHLEEPDLVEALDTGLLNGACLDVFNEEPLPADHELWSHPKVTITPHIASITNPKTALAQILDNFERQRAKRPLLNQIDRAKGY